MRQMPHASHTPAVPFHAYETRGQAAEALAEIIAGDLRQAIALRSQASLVVSGGSTPVPMFHALRHQALDWSKVTVTLADERWVPADSDDSNEKLVRDHLLPAGTNFVPLKNTAATIAAGVDAIEASLQSMPRPFDVVVLGMGEDGHTASLFPGHPLLEKALDISQSRLCMPIEDAPKPPPSRITLTYSALIQSRQLYLHITGKEKQAIVEQALAREDSPVLPVSAFLHQRQVPISIHWAA